MVASPARTRTTRLLAPLEQRERLADATPRSPGRPKSVARATGSATAAVTTAAAPSHRGNPEQPDVRCRSGLLPRCGAAQPGRRARGTAVQTLGLTVTSNTPSGRRAPTYVPRPRHTRSRRSVTAWSPSRARHGARSASPGISRTPRASRTPALHRQWAPASAARASAWRGGGGYHGRGAHREHHVAIEQGAVGNDRRANASPAACARLSEAGTIERGVGRDHGQRRIARPNGAPPRPKCVNASTNVPSAPRAPARSRPSRPGC